MDLTSYERMRRYIAGDGSKLLAATANARRDMLQWINSTSAKIERYLNRETFIQSYTQYFDLKYGSIEFWVKAPPIISITSVKIDPTGLYTGSESTLNTSEYFIGTDTDIVVLVNSLAYTGNRVVQIIYTGGYAYHGTRSVYAVTPSATWTAGKYCIGNTSLAVGIVRAASSTAMTVEVLYGTFIVAETLTEYNDEAGDTATAKTAVLDSKTQEALCESYPAITVGCEMEIRYLYKHKDDFENISSDKEGTTTRHTKEIKRKFPLQTEVAGMIAAYRRIAL